MRFILPELKENTDKVEVRKALIDAEKQINEKNDSQDLTILSNSNNILDIYSLFPNIPTRVITANYTLQADDVLIMVDTNNAITITVPTGLKVGRGFTVKRVSSGLTANGVTVNFGTNTIYGAASIVIFGNSIAKTSKYTEQFSFLQTTSTTWEIVAGEDSGTTSLGYYRKKYDQICEMWDNSNVHGASATVANYFGTTAGTINYVDKTVNYPVTLTRVDSVFADTFTLILGISTFNPTTTQMTLRLTDNVSFLANTRRYTWQVIGKWIN